MVLSNNSHLRLPRESKSKNLCWGKGKRAWMQIIQKKLKKIKNDLKNSEL